MEYTLSCSFNNFKITHLLGQEHSSTKISFYLNYHHLRTQGYINNRSTMVSSRTDLSHGMRWLLPRFAVIFMATIILPKCLTGSLPPVLPPLPIPPKPKLHSKSIKDIDSMVEKYIQPLQGNPIEMLEIGAGWGVVGLLFLSQFAS